MNTLPYAQDPAKLARATSAFVVVGIVAPLAIALVGVILMLLWLPELPSPAATHWGTGSGPDGFGPGWTFPVIFGSIVVAFTVFIGIAGLASARAGRWGATLRLLGAFSPAFAVFLAIALGGSVAGQRGLADATQAPSPGLELLFGVIGAVVVGVIAWFLQPHVEVAAERTEPVAAAVIPDHGRVVWTHTVRTSAAGIVVAIVAVLASVVGAVVMAFTGSPSAWVLGGVALVLAIAMLSTMVFTVTADASGLTVRGFVGVPRWRIAAADIASVSVVHVDPIAEFGGWGLRWAVDGRFGVVIRRGVALSVRRRDGKVFVVTVDDAERGAAVLTAMAERSAS